MGENAGSSVLSPPKKPFMIHHNGLSAGLFGIIILGHLAINTLVQDEQMRFLMTGSALLIEKLLGIAVLYYTARETSRYKRRYASSWYFWLYGLASSLLADITWIILETIFKQPPSPSIADVFYILFYVFIGIGLAKYPGEVYRAEKRTFVILDNIVVVLGAGLGFSYLLTRPMIISSQEIPLAALMGLIYPVLDVLLLWGILIFFRSHSEQSTYLPLVMIGLGALFAIGSDVLFVYQTVHQVNIFSTWISLGWIAGSLAFIFAGIQEVKLLHSHYEDTRPLSSLSRSQKSRSWPIYLPYFWLAVAYTILSISLSGSRDQISIYIVVGLIIALVILRQVLTLNENENLYRKAQEELIERKQAQESLRQVNLELDERVQQRTEELHHAYDLIVQANQKLECSLHEKEILLKETHHRVKNNLQTVSSLLNLQSRITQDPDARLAFQESRLRIQSMALIHEKLYQSGNLAEINLRPYIENLTTILFQSYQARSDLIQLTTQVEDITVGADTAVPIGLILNELISNSLKHAFPNQRSGVISITLMRESAESITLRCQDDGCGMSASQQPGTSKTLGLLLVNSLSQQLLGEVEVTRSPGTQFTIRIPLAEIHQTAHSIDTQLEN